MVVTTGRQNAIPSGHPDFACAVMRVSAKSPTRLSREPRYLKKIAALEHFKKGGRPAVFAKKHGIPRTTVIGWWKRWETDRCITTMGRPRKLEPFNESAILELLIANKRFQDWKDVRDCIRKQIAEVGRRSALRYLRRWELASDSKPSSVSLSLQVAEWVQPANTVDKGNSQQRGMIWRLISGRGMERFMFTTDESSVATQLAKNLKSRKKELWTNHKRLAEILRNILSDWTIEFGSEK